MNKVQGVTRRGAPALFLMPIGNHERTFVRSWYAPNACPCIRMADLEWPTCLGAGRMLLHEVAETAFINQLERGAPAA